MPSGQVRLRVWIRRSSLPASSLPRGTTRWRNHRASSIMRGVRYGSVVFVKVFGVCVVIMGGQPYPLG